MDLSNKQLVVTGGNGVLGRAVAQRALELGAAVVALDVATDNLPFGVTGIAVDLLDRNATRKVFNEIGAIDVLVNVAGGFAMGAPAWAAEDDEWDRMFAINVTTMRNAVKAAVPLMLASGRGSIVNIGAFGALHGQAEMSAYTAAKSTVMRLTESLAEELKTRGINVNAVLPGVIDTPANRAAMPDADSSLWVAPGDLANVICFLASDAGRAVQGALIPVTGAQR